MKTSPLDQAAFEYIQNSKDDLLLLAVQYGISEHLAGQIRAGKVKTLAEARVRALEIPAYRITAELRARTREEAARWLREMAKTIESDSSFRSESTSGVTWSVELGPGVSEHERQG